MIFKSKRGEALIEGAIVLPLIVLIIFSLIMVMVYFYNGAHIQFTVHKESMMSLENDQRIFGIETFKHGNEKDLGGIYKKTLNNYIYGRYYYMNELKLLRIGNEIVEYIEE